MGGKGEGDHFKIGWSGKAFLKVTTEQRSEQGEVTIWGKF